ncbi:hypothetical protein FHW36_105287 [Chitinophaga polysaccharea]|uniref:Outer membrane protein with beta-barrel domain n=1 Tax=Chitinophaga polysaccharea TaxID=1293035 RepID=A0A561PP13_9BACT|nr:hypothetical protein [Chitinophaga polysaccharea]TWF39847.1 hypothetical protein FHW36_105287 [Chitinophaga polysaccharea]
MAGIEYLHKKWFYLSSEVGYVALGERHTLLVGRPGGNMSWYNFAQVNTTFRARHLSPSAHTEFFAGAGPYLNILLNNNKKDHPLFEAYDTKTCNTGIKTEAGIVRNINRFRVGLTGNYLLRLSPVATSPHTKINYNVWGITLGLGYKLH